MQGLGDDIPQCIVCHMQLHILHRLARYRHANHVAEILVEIEVFGQWLIFIRPFSDVFYAVYGIVGEIRTVIMLGYQEPTVVILF